MRYFEMDVSIFLKFALGLPLDGSISSNVFLPEMASLPKYNKIAIIKKGRWLVGYIVVKVFDVSRRTEPSSIQHLKNVMGCLLLSG